MCDGDRAHHQDQARELAQAVQKAVAETNASDQQNVTINFSYSPVYNYGGNISLHSSPGSGSSSSSNNSINSSRTNINTSSINNHDRRVFNNITVKQDQPLQIQTDSFLKHTVYDSDEVARRKLKDLCFEGTAQSLDQILHGTAKVVDERGSGFTSTAFFAKIRLHGRLHPALFTAGHVFDLTESGVDSKGLEKVHLIFNNLKGRDEVHSRRKLGSEPIRLKLFQDIIKWGSAVTCACHKGKMYVRRKREWRVTDCEKDLDFAAVVFEESVESFERVILRKYNFSPFLFKVATSSAEDPGRPVILFGYPSFRKELTFLFGTEMCVEDILAKLRKEISSANGYKRDDLINFDEGLKHVLLYDIVTHSGASGAPILNYQYEAKAIHVRSSPRPFNVVNQGTSFSVIGDLLERVM